MKRIAIFGATGYTGFELIRMLLSHPGAKISVLTSEQYSGLPVAEAFPPFKGRLADVSFGKMERLLGEEFDVAFLALPHTLSSAAAGPLIGRGVTVVDLSADFRFRSIPLYESIYGVTHKDPGLAAEAVYGLPEVYREAIRKTRLAAVPGCFPTSVILGLRPLAAGGVIAAEGIVADCKTGVSGGGRGPKLGFHFPEVDEGLRAYGLPRHRHNAEMDQELSLAAGRDVAITFVPHLVPMVRGIHATCYAALAPGRTPMDVDEAFRNAYTDEPFVRLLPPGLLPSTKDVRGSNFCDIAWHVDEATGRVVVFSAIDNLVKGASGAAVQCFNLMCGFPEEEGLRGMPLYP